MRRAGWIRLGVIAGAVGVLEVVCRLGVVDRQSVVAPSSMVVAAGRVLGSGEYGGDILMTFGTVVVAVLLSVVGGGVFGVVLFSFPRLKRAADPFLASYYAVPSFMFYPLFIVLFGLNRWPLVAVAFVFAFVAMAIATVDGFSSVRPILRRVARSFGLSRGDTMRLVVLPAASPYFFTGVKLAVAYAFIGVVAGEFILSGAGLGYRIAFAYQSFETETMYGLMLILLGCVVAINVALGWGERWLQARYSGVAA